MTGVTDRGYQPLSGSLVCSQRASSLGCILLSLSIRVKRAGEVVKKLNRTGLLLQRAARKDEKVGVIARSVLCARSNPQPAGRLLRRREVRDDSIFEL